MSILDCPHPFDTTYALHLSGGLGVRICAADQGGAAAADLMAQVMRLEVAGPLSDYLPRLWLCSDDNFIPPTGEFVQRVGQTRRADALFNDLIEVSGALARILLSSGAMLLHGALGALPRAALGQPDSSAGKSIGVLLAAPGGTGKSTAASRLPPPWHALSDDAAMVLCQPGRAEHTPIWVHPWPTFSRFLDGGPGGSWSVQEATELNAVFFLERAPAEEITAIGEGSAAIHLYESAIQINSIALRRQTPARKQAMQGAMFAQCSYLALHVPCARLRLSLHGAFWLNLQAHLQAQINEFHQPAGQ